MHHPPQNSLPPKPSDQRCAPSPARPPALTRHPGHVRSPSSRSSKSPPAARHADNRSRKIPHRSPHRHHPALLGSVRSLPAAPSVGQCCTNHDRVIWQESCNGPCAVAVLDSSSGRIELQYEDPCHGGSAMETGELQLTPKPKDEEYQDRSAKLLTANANQVLDLLSMYIQASGMPSFFRALTSLDVGLHQA